MGYTDVTVIVEDALSEERTFTDEQDEEMEKYIEGWKQDMTTVPTEIYKLYHPHDAMGGDFDECMCIQYLTDHTPYWSNK